MNHRILDLTYGLNPSSRKVMCEEEYKEKFKDCQLLVIREALRRYKVYSGLSGFHVADKISDHNGIEIGHDVVDRFLQKGRFYRPWHEYVRAIVFYLLSRKANYELKRRHLEIREDSYDIPTELSRLFLKRGIGASITNTGDEGVKYNELNVVYKSDASTEKETKSIMLYINLPQDGEFFVVREIIETVNIRNKENLIVTELEKRKKLICYDGFGLVMPEGYVLFLMKDTEFGHNHVIITSNKFDFYTSKTAPQEFFAVIRDEDINFYDCNEYSGYSGFCYMVGKTLTFIKQD